MIGGVALLAGLLQAAPAPAAQAAPQPPPTEVYLAAIEPSTDGNIRVGMPENITSNPGYDNQPFFLPTGDALLFTSMRDGKQTDIYKYTLASRSTTPLTRTPESEYSPTPMADGRFSVIRVESDGTQRVWVFPAAGGAPSILLADVKPVGYHAWAADGKTLVLFVLGEPPALRIADVRTGLAQVVVQRPGRCIARMPGGDISFVQKGPGKEPWQIVQLDVATKKQNAIVETLEGREDYAWLPDGRLLMASGPKIFIWGKDSRVTVWQEVADFAAAGIGNITRMAVSPDGKRLALVGEPDAAGKR